LDDLPQKRLFRVSEVASYFRVVDRTVYHWIKLKRLKTEKTPGGQYRVTIESINEYRQKKT
jgi:excisionase family DNA binding protein